MLQLGAHGGSLHGGGAWRVRGRHVQCTLFNGVSRATLTLVGIFMIQGELAFLFFLGSYLFMVLHGS